MIKIVARILSISIFLILPFLISCSGGGSSGETSSEPVAIPAGAERWSDPATWGGTKPIAGQSVTIPEGKVIALDEDPPSLSGIDIKGTLIIARRNTNLSTGWITVNGKMEIGTETEPFLQRLVITLNGRPGSDPQGREGGFMVAGGTVDIHGATGKVSWTRLAETAAAGTNSLVLQSAPGWQPGDQIVLASTDFDMNQAEQLVVAAVNGNVVTVASSLRYTHWGGTENGVEERAEVGLLSRNIRIQGDGQSPEDGMGGHLMAMAGSTLRISGVEFYRMGRKGKVGRYPIHFHLMGDATGSYAKENSVHHSFNRSVTLHGSHNALVLGNVSYDILGHCYFLEDGIETANLLENNLGLVTRRPPVEFQILVSDNTPATFWISNPDNALRGNAAAGSASFGFWYDLSEHPTGLSATDTVFPKHVPLREFSGNSAHSNALDGLFVDKIGGKGPFRPRVGGRPDGSPVRAHFSDFTAFKNSGRGVWCRGDYASLESAKLADNAIGVTFASAETVLVNSVVIGETANKGTPSAGQVVGLDGRTLPLPQKPDFPIRGFEIYDGRVGSENVSFVNFQPNSQRQASAVSDLRFNRFQLDLRNYVSGLTFDNANPVYFDQLGANPDRPNDEDGHRSVLFVDLDGSVTGAAGSRVVINNPFLHDNSCILRGAWNAFVCQDVYGRLGIENLDANPLGIAPLEIVREENGVVQILAGRADPVRTQFYTSLINLKNYRIGFNGPVPHKLRLQYRFRTGGDWIQLAVSYPYTQVSVFRDGNFSAPLAGVASIEELIAGSGGSYFYDTARQILHVKLMVKNGADAARLDVEGQ